MIKSDKNEGLILNFRDINHTMRALYEGKGSQKQILILLRKSGSITQRELTQRLGIQPGSASEVISKLENSELIVRKASDTDRRTTDIELTVKGAELADQALEQRIRRHDEMFECLSDSEKDQLLSLLKKINTDWSVRYRETRSNNHCAERYHRHCGTDKNSEVN
ncbi:MAG: MarR family winged helix-turn-helix transcriptional regulator [Acutalibacteraceae bacterium]